jgi:branched-subunit amino acid transport protein
MVLAILLPVERLDMVQGMGVGVATLVMQVLGVILHKAVDLVDQSMEVLMGNQIMAVATAVCNPGLLSKERRLEFI